MQEMKKQSIVIASVLKPLDDTRMTEKMGVSLVNTNQWDVHIVGYGASVPDIPSITFHPIGTFARISIQRLLGPWQILFILFRIRPSHVIITTHELLLIAFVFKVFSRVRILYDVQENYLLNILNTEAFPSILKFFIAYYVRAKEWIFSPIISQFFLAEKCYLDELPFLGNRYTVIENKCIKPKAVSRQSPQNQINLIFSGTLDDSTGVFEAVALAKELHLANPQVSSTIIGYAPRTSVQKRIRHEAKGHIYIKLIGIDSLVPHSKILEEITQSDAGIICYQPQQHTRNRIPTKLYEYAAYQLPILYSHDATWAPMLQDTEAGISINFKSFSSSKVLELLKTKKFYSKKDFSVTWDGEESRLIHALS